MRCALRSSVGRSRSGLSPEGDESAVHASCTRLTCRTANQDGSRPDSPGRDRMLRRCRCAVCGSSNSTPRAKVSCSARGVPPSRAGGTSMSNPGHRVCCQCSRRGTGMRGGVPEAASTYGRMRESVNEGRARSHPGAHDRSRVRSELLRDAVPVLEPHPHILLFRRTYSEYCAKPRLSRSHCFRSCAR